MVRGRDASPRELAERMAGKADLIKDVLGRTPADDENLQSELAAQFHAFRENPIHDITAEDFADIYAETVAYGMFAARLHDRTRDTFSRREALELLPKSNPFLRSLFTYVAGYDLDDRIAWIVDDRACDVAGLMDGFGGITGQNDPFLHFYKTFLAAVRHRTGKGCPSRKTGRAMACKPTMSVRPHGENPTAHAGCPKLSKRSSARTGSSDLTRPPARPVADFQA